MPELVHLSADAPSNAIAEVLDRDGALILDDAIAPAALAALKAELAPFVEATPTGRDGFTGQKTTRTGALVARAPTCRPLVTDARIQALCAHLLKPNCERWQLHLTQLIRIMPGQGAQPIHRDRWAWGAHLKGVEPQLNTIWALTDFTAENGATQVVPEVLESSLMLASQALTMLGLPQLRVQNRIDQVRRDRYHMLHGFYHGAKPNLLDSLGRPRILLHAVNLTGKAHACGKALHDLDLSAFNVELQAIRREGDELQLTANPVLQEGDALLLAGPLEAIESCESWLLAGIR